MAVLLNAVTTSTDGSWTDMTAPCTVYCDGTFDGSVQIQVKTSNVSERIVAQFSGKDEANYDGYGSYSIRAVSKLKTGSGAVTVEAVPKE